MVLTYVRRSSSHKSLSGTLLIILILNLYIKINMYSTGFDSFFLSLLKEKKDLLAGVF